LLRYLLFQRHILGLMFAPNWKADQWSVLVNQFRSARLSAGDGSEATAAVAGMSPIQTRPQSTALLVLAPLTKV
jgi:hypothetical protein